MTGLDCQSHWQDWRKNPHDYPFWIMLLLVFGKLDNGMIRVWQPNTGIAKMPSTGPIPSVTANQLTRALGEAVVRIWSNNTFKIVYFRRR
jgi:hypothetical protein